MKQRRLATASWMLVPIVLVAPALISGLSLWYDWGPQWPALAIMLAGALLALMLDRPRALRYGLLGALAGLATCPLLLLLGNPAWDMFAIWIAGASVLAGLLVPLVFPPAQHSSPKQAAQRSTHADMDTLEHIASSTQQISSD